MTRPLRIGVQIQPQHADYAQIRDAVRRAEDLGVDVIFNWDHFFPLYGDPDGKHFECWTMLGAWAEQTSRVEIGALVTCNSYRNPELLADMARTVDHISGGRLILGIGAGWFEKDYDQFGYEFGIAGSRIAELASALPRIRARLAAGNPAPTRDIPILIGGGGEKKTLRLVAQYGDACNLFSSTPEEVAHKLDVLRGHCDAVGRDFADIRVTMLMGGDELLTGDVDGFVAAARPYADLGVETVILRPPADLSLATWVRDHVAPAVPRVAEL